MAHASTTHVSTGLTCIADPYTLGQPLCCYEECPEGLSDTGTPNCLKCICFSNNVELYMAEYGISTPPRTFKNHSFKFVLR